MTEEAADERDHILWTRDRLCYTSVGIDIGTATVQVVFTEIEMRRLGRQMSSRFVPVSQTVRYASPIIFTPYLGIGAGMDAERVAVFVRDCYTDAGQTPDGILTGVVLLTGNALLQRNARALAESLAEVQGDFVCHGAGHDMEARISAHGSGSVAMSREQAAAVLNIDVGGGTTKLAFVQDGTVVRTAAVGVGSRSIILDETGAVLSADGVAAATASSLGIDVTERARPPDADLARLADKMMGGVRDVIRGGPGTSSAPLLTAAIPDLAFDIVLASGGVAQYLTDESDHTHGDLGWFLAGALRKLLGELGRPARIAQTPIRATVLGCARDTVQLSGSTIYVSDPDVLPLRNVPLAGVAAGAAADAVALAGAVAFPVGWSAQPTQQELLGTLESVIAAVSRLDGTPVVVLILERDLAYLTGQIAKHEMGLRNELICIDGISTEDLDYVDVARLDQATSTLQVTMKSLLFGPVRP